MYTLINEKIIQQNLIIIKIDFCIWVFSEFNFSIELLLTPRQTRVPFRDGAILTAFFAHSCYSEILEEKMVIILLFDFLKKMVNSDFSVIFMTTVIMVKWKRCSFWFYVEWWYFRPSSAIRWWVMAIWKFEIRATLTAYAKLFFGGFFPR